MEPETENAVAIAELKGALKAQRAENDAMESRLDTGLALLREDMAKWETAAAKRETDAVKREKQQLLAIAGLIALATTILGLWLGG